MNESEKRREELLREAKSSYNHHMSPPVHPRYRSTTSLIYGSSAEHHSGSFGIRCLISLLIFLLFAAADYEKQNLGSVSTGQIIAEIKKEPFIEFLPK